MSYLSIYKEPVRFRKIVSGNSNCFFVNNDYIDILQQKKLFSFEDIWSFKDGELLAEKGERSIARFQLLTDKGDIISLYIKRHVQSLSICNRLYANSFVAEGVKEFNNYCAFRLKGLATPVPVAAGVRYLSSSCVQSFLVTRDFHPLVPLEDLLLNTPGIFVGSSNLVKRQRILSAVASYAIKMHTSGFNQQDFNATHILVDDPDSTRPLVALFDLQRVDTGYMNRYRWPVKALAEFIFTLPDDVFSDEDRLFLFKRYKGIDRLSLWDRFQYSWILRKVKRIRRHTEKKRIRAYQKTR